MIDHIAQIENRAYQYMGLNSRPMGQAYMELIANLILDILVELDFRELSEETVRQLEEENYHAAAMAVRKILEIRQYENPFKYCETH